MSELKPCLKKIHDLLDALDTTTCITLSPNILADKYYGVFDCDGCKSSKHYLGDLFDEDICLSCWKEAAQVGVQCIEDALRTENEALKARVAELEAEKEEIQDKLTDKIDAYVKIAVDIIDRYGEDTYEGEYAADSEFAEEISVDIESIDELVTKMANRVFTLEQEKNNKQWESLPTYIENRELEEKVAELEKHNAELIAKGQKMYKALEDEVQGTKVAYSLLGLEEKEPVEKALDAIRKLQADNARMREALEYCANTFAEYAKIHGHKPRTEDNLSKIKRNVEMARLCEQALKDDKLKYWQGMEDK